MRLLVVDDDQLMAHQVALLARRAQVEAVTVATSLGDVADEDLTGFDIVILDLMMPGLDGIEWMRRFAQLGVSMRLILLSALPEKVMELASQTALGYGHQILGCLQKPAYFGELEYLLAIAEEVAPRSRQVRVGVAARDVVAPVEESPDNGRFSLLFQPQLGLASGSWFGVKVMASRYESQLTEGAGNIGLLARIETLCASVPFTLLLVERGLEAMAGLCADAEFDGVLTVDVLPSAIAQPDFTAQVLALIARQAASSVRLNLHIDGVEPNHARTAVQHAQARFAMNGIIVSSDQIFAGTGSLLVLDSAVIHRLQQAEKVRKLVRAQIKMCHEVGMTVLAQGVDDLWTGRWLAEADCDIAQGVWVGAPMSLGELSAWARGRKDNPVDVTAGSRG